ncbi:cation channel sperm-associated protein 3 [Balearica regulorum gibbericeps]|uniref:cation channel sperm-associated protein 3 n=1 Tax=Balearica regulorum gibbericeps TaxID=100784 RepID=UPI003F5D765E
MPCKQLWVRSSREIDTSEMPERITRMTPAAQPPATEKRKDAKLRASLRRLLGSHKFTALVICIVSINVSSPAVKTNYRCRLCWGTLFEVADVFFIAVYTTKLLLKLYVAPIAYWKTGYNILDATILLLTFIPHVLPVDITTCTHLEGTNQRSPDPPQTLGQMVQTVMYALILLFLLTFVFAGLGHGWYGDPKTGDTENWGSLKAALFTLFSLITESTVDGWTDLQCEMDHYGFTSSHVFIVVFILLGNFIFFNMLIALVITKTQVMRAVCIECACVCECVWLCDLTQKYEQDCKAVKKAAVWAKKQKILKKQGKNVSDLVTLEQGDSPKCHLLLANSVFFLGLFFTAQNHSGEDFGEPLDDIKKTLCHSDIIIMESFYFTIPFIDLYLPFLDLWDDTLNRLQHRYYERTGISLDHGSHERKIHEKMKS